jgi:hypothetical protein
VVFAIRISQSLKRLLNLLRTATEFIVSTKPLSSVFGCKRILRCSQSWEKEMNMCAKRNSPWIHRADSQMPFDLMSDGGAEEAESGG